jgi:hypothetical protein
MRMGMGMKFGGAETLFSNKYYLDFGGTDEYVQCGQINELLNTDKVLLSFWGESATISDTLAISNADTSIVNRFALIKFTDGKLYFICGGGGIGHIYCKTDSAISNNELHLYGVSFDGSLVGDAKVQMFIDSVSVPFTVTGTIPDTVCPVMDEFTIGKYDPTYFSKGIIDEPVIVNNFIGSPTTIFESLYGGGTPETCGDPGSIPNVLENWRMGDKATWDGSNWTFPGQQGNYNGTSNLMEESDVKEY